MSGDDQAGLTDGQRATGHNGTIARRRFAIRGWPAFLLWMTIGLSLAATFGLLYAGAAALLVACPLLFIALIWARFAPEGPGPVFGFWGGLAPLQALLFQRPVPALISATIAIAAAAWYVRVSRRVAS